MAEDIEVLYHITEAQIDNLRRMWENGCPCYADSDPDGYQYCWFCNCYMDFYNRIFDHLPDCPWLTLDEFFADAD